MLPTRSSSARTDNGPSLLMDFDIISPHGTHKLLFKKNDNDSIGLTLKKVFLWPFMQIQARQHIVSLFETTLNGFDEADKFVASVKQDKSWFKGVNAGRVKEIIAHAALCGQELKNPQDRDWSDMPVHEIVTEYLSEEGNLNSELIRLLKLKNLPDKGLSKLMYYADNPNATLKFSDYGDINSLMKNIKIIEDSPELNLPQAFSGKICAIFDNYVERFKEAEKKSNFTEILAALSPGENPLALSTKERMLILYIPALAKNRPARQAFIPYLSKQSKPVKAKTYKSLCEFLNQFNANIHLLPADARKILFPAASALEGRLMQYEKTYPSKPDKKDEPNEQLMRAMINPRKPSSCALHFRDYVAHGSAAINPATFWRLDHFMQVEIKTHSANVDGNLRDPLAENLKKLKASLQKYAIKNKLSLYN